MVDNSDFMLPTNDLGSYIEVPEKRDFGNLPARPAPSEGSYRKPDFLGSSPVSLN
jgi:hypothetical protein